MSNIIAAGFSANSHDGEIDSLGEDHIAFIAQQPVLFVATVPLPGGPVNLSPKGMDSLRVLSPNRILWLNVTGSGNETAPQLAADPRIIFDMPPEERAKTSELIEALMGRKPELRFKFIQENAARLDEAEVDV